MIGVFPWHQLGDCRNLNGKVAASAEERDLVLLVRHIRMQYGRQKELHKRKLIKRSEEGLAAETLRRFNRDLQIESVGENISVENAPGLVGKADIVFSCAPIPRCLPQ